MTLRSTKWAQSVASPAMRTRTQAKSVDFICMSRALVVILYSLLLRACVSNSSFLGVRLHSAYGTSGGDMGVYILSVTTLITKQRCDVRVEGVDGPQRLRVILLQIFPHLHTHVVEVGAHTHKRQNRKDCDSRKRRGTCCPFGTGGSRRQACGHNANRQANAPARPHPLARTYTCTQTPRTHRHRRRTR